MTEESEKINVIKKLCESSGINLEDFLSEAILQLQERKRILLTPSKTWFLSKNQDLKGYYQQVLGYDPHIELVRSELARLRQFYLVESRKGLATNERLDKLIEQNKRCVICGTPINDESAIEDHIVPIAVGGKDAYDNIQLVCVECNQGKSDSLNFASLCAWKTSNAELRQGPTLTPGLRYAVLERDKRKCKVCLKASQQAKLLVIRKIDKSSGGQIVFDNLQACCESCAKTAEEG